MFENKLALHHVVLVVLDGHLRHAVIGIELGVLLELGKNLGSDEEIVILV